MVPFFCNLWDTNAIQTAPSDTAGKAVPKETGVMHQITLKEAARLATEAIKPLEAMGTNPKRCLTHQPGMEIKGSPHTKIHSRGKLRKIRKEPALLLGAAEAHPHTVGTTFRNTAADGFILPFRPLPHGRAIVPGYFHTGKTGSELLPQQRNGFLRTTEQKVAHAVSTPAIPHGLHHIRAVKAVRLCLFAAAKQPNDRHAIRADIMKALHPFSVFLLMQHAGEYMHIRMSYQTWLLRGSSHTGQMLTGFTEG